MKTLSSGLNGLTEQHQAYPDSIDDRDRTDSIQHPIRFGSSFKIFFRELLYRLLGLDQIPIHKFSATNVAGDVYNKLDHFLASDDERKKEMRGDRSMNPIPVFILAWPFIFWSLFFLLDFYWIISCNFVVSSDPENELNEPVDPWLATQGQKGRLTVPNSRYCTDRLVYNNSSSSIKRTKLSKKPMGTGYVPYRTSAVYGRRYIDGRLLVDSCWLSSPFLQCLCTRFVSAPSEQKMKAHTATHIEIGKSIYDKETELYSSADGEGGKKKSKRALRCKRNI